MLHGCVSLVLLFFLFKHKVKVTSAPFVLDQGWVWKPRNARAIPSTSCGRCSKGRLPHACGRGRESKVPPAPDGPMVPSQPLLPARVVHASLSSNTEAPTCMAGKRPGWIPAPLLLAPTPSLLSNLSNMLNKPEIGSSANGVGFSRLQAPCL